MLVLDCSVCLCCLEVDVVIEEVATPTSHIRLMPLNQLWWLITRKAFISYTSQSPTQKERPGHKKGQKWDGPNKSRRY